MVELGSFGRYQLSGLIGEGGMGQVYRAHDTVIGRDVALKVLPAHLATEPGYRERFRREALTAARLSEPHIIPIHDVGEVDGRLYLAMPVIDGVDVAGLIERNGPLHPRLAVTLIEQLAAALDAAHAQGLVHRDVKPSNALVRGVGSREFVYLIDFGIAHDATAAGMTGAGSVMGTLAYMAPERFTTGQADARADIYALACVLYECLTGTQPFPGQSMQQQIAGHLVMDPPRPTATRPGLPAGFDDVIACGMAKDPARRYRSAHELAVAAEQALTEPPTQRRPEPSRAADGGSRRRRTATLAGLVAGVVLIAAVTGFLWLNRTPTPQSHPPTAPTPLPIPSKPLFLPINGVSMGEGLFVDPKGNVYVTDSLRNRVLMLPPGEASTPVPLPFTGLKAPEGVTVDADGNIYVADTQNERVLKLPVGSSDPIELPFPGTVGDFAGIAVDSGGSVYACAMYHGQVLKLPVGSNDAVPLPFSGLKLPYDVAVDAAGSVYVADGGNNRVLKLTAGSNAQTVLPFTGLNSPKGVAVDSVGSVYVVDSLNYRVLELPVGSNTQIVLPYPKLTNPSAIAVDAAGSVYLGEGGRVVKLMAG